jgi:tRNA threonylcarbamoyladenosine biosynthesis protein TsaE
LVVGLQGRLGAGKTHFVRGVAEGLDVADPRIVSSPTFMLIHEYEARLPIYHFDSYRLPSEVAFEGLGVSEYFVGEGVSLVEWSDRVMSVLPAERIDVELSDIPGSESGRRIQAQAVGGRWEFLLRAWHTATREESEIAPVSERLRLVEEEIRL